MNAIPQRPGETANQATVVIGLNAVERPIVLFDFDGVLVRRDSFESYLRSRLRRQAWRLLAVLPLLPLLPLLLRHSGAKGWLARLFVRVATVGMSAAQFDVDVRAFGRHFASAPGIAVEQAIACLREHCDAGDRVLVVSATAQPLLDSILVALNLDNIEALGSPVAVTWCGASAKFHNYGSAKLLRLARYGIDAPWDVAYSDSRTDLPILTAARRAVLVNPPERDRLAVQAALGDRVETMRWPRLDAERLHPH